MKLRDWLEENRIAMKRAAGDMGLHYVTLQRYVAGTRLPDRAAIRRIHDYTGGAVTANDFHGIPEQQPWLVALAPPDRRGAFLRLGWEPWPSGEAAESGLMRRKRRPGEGWRELLAELAYLAMILPPGAPPLDQGALVASGTDPD